MSKKTKDEYYKEIKKLAEEKNISLLSSEYTNNKTLLLFKCNNVECCKEWYDSRANIIRRKSGFKCPKCGGGINRHYTIDDMNEIAALKSGGGRCLSKRFKGTKKYHLWECFTCGHKWFAKPEDIIGKPSRPQGTWCPKCSRGIGERICKAFFEEIFHREFSKENKLNWLRKRKMHLDGYNNDLKIAFEYQGKQHYIRIPRYHPTEKDFKAYQERDKYKRVMCKKNGIILIEVGYKNINGIWRKIKYEEMGDFIIKECEKKGISVPKRRRKIEWSNFNVAPTGYLEEIKEIALMKGGKCLSKYWFGARENHEFVCAEGHHFKATPSKIKGTPKRPKGSWCPERKYKDLPQNQLKYNKEYLDKLAILRGGLGSKCLSPEYLGRNKKYIWECSKGHVFSSRFDSVKGYHSRPEGSWCRQCYLNARLKKF